MPDLLAVYPHTCVLSAVTLKRNTIELELLHDLLKECTKRLGKAKVVCKEWEQHVAKDAVSNCFWPAAVHSSGPSAQATA